MSLVWCSGVCIGTRLSVVKLCYWGGIRFESTIAYVFNVWIDHCIGVVFFKIIVNCSAVWFIINIIWTRISDVIVCVLFVVRAYKVYKL